MKRNRFKRIGILTAGGDCPGLNPVIRAVTKTAIHDYDLEVFGIEDGYEGLISKRGRILSSEHVSGILTHGGTILGTSNTANPFKVPIIKNNKVSRFEDQSDHAIRHFKEWGLDVLIAVGGDGTLGTALKLSQKGVPVIGIPKTIDNDLAGTDFTFGFDTAVCIATEAVDRLHTTAASHHRVMILEVMGRNAGWIALHAGTAGGADIILIPEIPYDFRLILNEIKFRAKKGKRFSLMVVAEGAYPRGGKPFVQRKDLKNPYPDKLGGIANILSHEIERQTGVESRAAILGHIQRGGSPSAFDRNLGTLFGQHAVEILMQGLLNHMVCLRGQKIEAIPIRDVIHQRKLVPRNHPIIKAARAVGTCFGDGKPHLM